MVYNNNNNNINYNKIKSYFTFQRSYINVKCEHKYFSLNAHN